MAAFFRKFHKHVITTRAGNRAHDGRGLDLCNDDEAVNGRLPVSVQTKSTVRQPDFHALITRMKGMPMPLVFWSRSQTTESGRTSSHRDEYVVMKAEDFRKIYEGYMARQTAVGFLDSNRSTSILDQLE